MTPYTRAIEAVSRELNPSSPQSPITRNKAEKVVRAVLGAVREPPREAIDAFAEAWATIEGDLAEFRSCRADPAQEAVVGRYEGYMVAADKLLASVRAHGFGVVALTESGDGK